MSEVIKILKGHSGSEVYLCEDHRGKFVLKHGNVDRNYERMGALRKVGIRVPKFYGYNYFDQTLQMEYIHGLDMGTYLTYNSPNKLIDFLLETLDTLRNNYVGAKDYTESYKKWLYWYPYRDELIERLPKILPQSVYIGDLTLENIIYGNDGKFYIIDPVTLPFDSYMFDIAKLRQDIDFGWFMRHEPRVMPELTAIHDAIYKEYSDAFDDSLCTLMLLRVFRHCSPGTLEYNFISEKVKKLWK